MVLCNYERMGSNTLIRTYFLEEPLVHPILSHKVKTDNSLCKSKGRSRLAGLCRRAGLKHQWQQCCGGSIPPPGTKKSECESGSEHLALFSRSHSDTHTNCFGCPGRMMNYATTIQPRQSDLYLQA